MPRTNFTSNRNGFHFPNAFVNHVLKLPGIGEITTFGRCGGMAFAALDYYHADFPIPTHVTADFATGVPPDGHPLADYIYARLMDSFVLNGLKFVTWTQALDHETVLRGKGVIRMTKEDEIPKLRQKLDEGTPVPLGLVVAGPDDILLTQIGENHQVVAYGYDFDENAGEIKVYAYDNRSPDTEFILSTNVADMSTYVDASAFGRWRGFFVEDYTPHTPSYLDMALFQGISVSSLQVAPGGPLDCKYTVKNYGSSPAHLQNLLLSLRGPSGENLDNLLGGDGNSTDLQPGQERAISKATPHLSTHEGRYLIGASYFSRQGESLNIPQHEPGTSNQVSVDVRVPPRQLDVTVKPYPVPRDKPITLTVHAQDTSTHATVSGIVNVTGMNRNPHTDEPFTYTFHCTRTRVRTGDGWEIRWKCPSGTVTAPSYPVTKIDFGLPDGEDM